MGQFKKAALPLIILSAAVFVVVGLTMSRPKPQPQLLIEPPAPKVQAMIAEPGQQQIVVYAQGTVQPKREIALAAQVPGQVVSVSEDFVDGGFFKQGDSLLQLDSRDYHIEAVRTKSRIAEAEQLLAMEKGRALQAKREWRDLGNKAGNALFLREPQLKAAQAALEAAKADLDQVNIDLERTVIMAPFDGRIRDIQVNVGQYLSAGMKVAQVFSSDTAQIRLPLTASQTGLLSLPLTPHQGNQLPVKLSAMFSGERHQWQGVISRTDASIDTRSRVMYGIVEVDKPFESNPPLVIGLFVNAEILGRTFDGVIVVPRMALYEKDKLLVVSDDNRLRIQSVRVLQDRGEVAFVTGVEAGDIILVDRPGYVVEGMKISPVISAPDDLAAQ
ncbi:MAG: efflux RND transporter periplasmic adaptor subunit [Porticoccus sp.]